MVKEQDVVLTQISSAPLYQSARLYHQLLAGIHNHDKWDLLTSFSTLISYDAPFLKTLQDQNWYLSQEF